MNELPISIIVPLSPSRLPLFEAAVLPSIRANRPAEIHIIPEGANANVKRNAGAKHATQPYLFFCDDDVILANDCLSRLVASLEQAPPYVAYTYGDYVYVNHPRRKTGVHQAGAWNARKLRQANYVSTMSLIRRSAFPGFDESLTRLQDYDLWLTMLTQGQVGQYIGGHPLFCALYVGECTTRADGFEQAMKIVHQKHGIEWAA